MAKLFSINRTTGDVKFQEQTASRLLSLNASYALTSVDNLASWITGTPNRVSFTDDGDGTGTLTGPQDIHTGASPTFAGLNTTGRIQAVTSVFPPIRGKRTSSVTNSAASAIAVLHSTSGDMVDGFGAGFEFSIEDNAGVINNIANIVGARDGADNSGAIVLSVRAAGSLAEVLRLYSTQIAAFTGKVGIGIVPNIQGATATSSLLTIGGGSIRGILEISSTLGDVDGGLYGDITIVHGNTTAAEKRLIIIRGSTDGSTANNRGGRIDFLLKRDGLSTFFSPLTLRNTGRIGINKSLAEGQLHIDQSNAGGVIPVLVLDQADVSEGFINFIGSDRGVITETTDSLKSVRVELGGVVYRLALYVDA